MEQIPKTGRPTKYDPSYCEMLIRDMEDGYSVEAFAGLIGVSKQTLYNWFDQYPEFLDAKEIGLSKSRRYFEGKGNTGLEHQVIRCEQSGTVNTVRLNTQNWIFQMKNRFKWKDNPDDKKDDNKPIVMNFYDHEHKPSSTPEEVPTKSE